MRLIKRKELKNQPTMVIGCEMTKETLRAMFKSSATFAMRARARDTVFTAISLGSFG